MIAVITGLLQSTGFLWECLVFPGIWLSQSLAEAIHRSLWKQKDNFSVSHPFSCLAGVMQNLSKNYQTAVVLYSRQMHLLSVFCFSSSRNGWQYKAHFLLFFFPPFWLQVDSLKVCNKFLTFTGLLFVCLLML